MSYGLFTWSGGPQVGEVTRFVGVTRPPVHTISHFNLNTYLGSPPPFKQAQRVSKGITIVFKTKGPQIRCIPHGSLVLFQCKRTCWLTKIS